jgi:hypothetical protein
MAAKTVGDLLLRRNRIGLAWNAAGISGKLR